MSSVDVSIIIAFATFIMSVSVSMFVSGMKWGQVTGDIKSINERLAKIEGMFTLTLKDGHSNE